MKNSIKIIASFVIMITLLIACNCQKNNSTAKNGFIEGKVTEIISGKDGYTAKIKANSDSIYFVTISRANLKDPQQYKSVAVGATIQVKGDIWKLEKENHITVRELK